MRTPGSGRKPGSVNKKTEALQEIADRNGVNPFEILCLIAKGDLRNLGYQFGESQVPLDYQIDIATRMGAAKEAARYLYPQRKAVELSTDESGFKIVLCDYTSKAKP